jgi:hypothetical protein
VKAAAAAGVRPVKRRNPLITEQGRSAAAADVDDDDDDNDDNDDDDDDDAAEVEAAGAIGGCEGVATCNPNPSGVSGRLMVNTAYGGSWSGVCGLGRG